MLKVQRWRYWKGNIEVFYDSKQGKLGVDSTVPRVGDRVESQGHELTVEGTDSYKLTQIRVSRLDVPAEGPDSGDPVPDH